MLRVTEGVASGEPDWPEWGRKLSFCAVVLRKWLFSSHGSELHKFRSSFPRFLWPKARVKAMKSKSKTKLANGDD